MQGFGFTLRHCGHSNASGVLAGSAKIVEAFASMSIEDISTLPYLQRPTQRSLDYFQQRMGHRLSASL